MPRQVNKQAVITKLVERWKPRLLLHNWAVITKLAAEDKSSDPEGLRVLAEIESRVPYKESTLTVFPTFWTEGAHTQEITILHELCHIVTEPMRTAIFTSKLSGKRQGEISEEATEHIAKVVWRSYHRRKKAKTEYSL